MIASRVMTAPLWGSASKPPEDSAVTRCISSMLMPCSRAMAANCSPRACRAMDMPPEAEPVIPASTFTATASEATGFVGNSPSTASRMMAKAGSEAITAP